MIKKVIAGLVVAGAGVAAYFYVRNKSKLTESSGSDLANKKDKIGAAKPKWYGSDATRLKFDTLKVFADKESKGQVGFLLRNTPKKGDVAVGDEVFIKPKNPRVATIAGIHEVVKIEKVAGNPDLIQAIWVNIDPRNFFDIEYQDNNRYYNRKDYDYAHVFVKKKQLGII